MNNRDPKIKYSINGFINRLCDPEFDDQDLFHIMVLTSMVIDSEITIYNHKFNDKNAVPDLLNLKLLTEKLIAKIKSVKNSPLNCLTETRIKLLARLEEKLQEILDIEIVIRSKPAK